MQSSADDPGGSKLIAVLTAVVACCVVLSFATPVMAHDQSVAGENSRYFFQQDSPALSCLDGISKQQIAQQLNDQVIQQINTKIEEHSARIPGSVRSAMVGERVNTQIGSTYFSTVINENAQIERIETQRLENPTVRVTTDCNTIKNIFNSDNRQAALQAAINRGDITWEGVTVSSEIETSYGGKAVQTYTIVESGETGDVEDAGEGFSSGLALD